MADTTLKRHLLAALRRFNEAANVTYLNRPSYWTSPLRSPIKHEHMRELTALGLVYRYTTSTRAEYAALTTKGRETLAGLADGTVKPMGGRFRAA